MTRARQRLLLVVAALVAVVSTAVVLVPDRSEPRSAVGTRDDGRSVGDRPEGLQPGEIDILPEDEAEDVATGTDDPLEAGVRPTNTTVARATTTTRSGSAATTTSTTAPAVPPAPRSLVGRIAYTGWGGTLYSMLPDGTDVREEVACPDDSFGMGSGIDVSPDGTQLVRNCGLRRDAELGLQPADGYGLVVQDVATGARRTLLATALFDAVYPHWSPDGRTIATMWSSTSDIRLIDTATGAVRSLTPDPPVSGTITSWTPDGRHLVLIDGTLVDVETGGRSQLEVDLPPVIGATEHRFERPVWAADGWIYGSETAWARDEVTDRGVSLLSVVTRVNATTGEVQRVVDLGSDLLWELAQGPGGRLLITTRDRLLVTAADGSSRRALPFPWPYGSYTAARGTSA